MNKAEGTHVAGMAQITDYEEIAEILRSRKFVQGAYQQSGEFMGGTLSALDGEPHLARRRVLAQLFSDEAMAVYRDVYVTPAIETCLREELAGAEGPVRTDLVLFAERCLYRVAAAITGIDGLESQARADLFISRIQTVTTGLTLDWTREDPAVVAARAKAAREAFKAEFFMPSYERRLRAFEAHQAAGTLPRDALMLMIAHRHEAWPGDIDALVREVTVLLTAATQSGSAAVVHFMMRMEDWFAAHPEDRAAIAAEPQFLRDAAHESLRLTSGAPARIRMATEDITLASGRRVKAGERVAIWLVQGNKGCPAFGADAESFNPRRKVTAANVPPWGHSFSGGAHMCLGRPLVTGSRLAGKLDADGVMVQIARRLYAAGFELDANAVPSKDTATHYDVYAKVPVVLTRGAGLLACTESS